jgi:hypothetical protein
LGLSEEDKKTFFLETLTTINIISKKLSEIHGLNTSK